MQTKANIVVFPLGHLANDWAPSAIWLLTPAIALAMDLSPGDVGLLIAIHSVGASVAYIPAGLLGDHVRRRGLLLAATFWWVAIGYYLAASATTFWMLAAMLALAGMGDAAWHPLATGVMVQQDPGRRARVLGIHAMGGTLAEVGAPLCAGFLLAWFDWRTVLELSVLPAVLMGVVFLRTMHSIPPAAEHGVSRADIRELWEVWRKPIAIRILAIVIFYNMAMMAILSMTPLFLQSVHGFSAGTSGVAFAVMLLVGSLIQPFLGHLSDSIGRKRVITGALTVACAGSVCVAVFEQAFGLVGALILSAGLLTGIRAVLLAAVVEVAGRQESTTLGLAFTIMDGVGALGAVLAGAAGTLDLRYAFVLAAGLTAVALLLTLRHVFVAAGATMSSADGERFDADHTSAPAGERLR